MKKKKMVVYKFNGKWWIVVAWTILFFPIAIIYYFMRKEAVLVEVKS